LIKKSKFEHLEALIFSKEWKFAFSQHKLILDFLQKIFDEDFKEYIPFFNKMLEIHLENNKKMQKIMEKGKDNLRIKYENDIYDQNLYVLEEEDLKKQNEIFLSEKNTRFTKHMWDKSWKKMRTHYGPWMHPEFRNQNDKRFDPADFEYEKIKPNEFYCYKLWKYEIKNRSRPFLKLKLKEPQIVIRNREELKNKKHSILNKYQSILHLSPFITMNQEIKCLTPVLGGLQNDESFSNNSVLLPQSSSRIKSKFISDVKKNITNSIKVEILKNIFIIILLKGYTIEGFPIFELLENR